MRYSATGLTGKHWAAPYASSLATPPTCLLPVSGVRLGLFSAVSRPRPRSPRAWAQRWLSRLWGLPAPVVQVVAVSAGGGSYAGVLGGGA